MDSSSVTRYSLVSRIRQSDSAAWPEFVSLYRPLIQYWCRRNGVLEQDIGDVVQEIFFAVARSIDRYQPSGKSGSFRAWLWSLTRHKLIDALRRNERFPSALGGSSDQIELNSIPEMLDESDVSEQTQIRALLNRALEQIRKDFEPRSWQAFWRTTIDGLSVELVAKELEMSHATVRQHRSRILRRLRQHLGELE